MNENLALIPSDERELAINNLLKSCLAELSQAVSLAEVRTLHNKAEFFLHMAKQLDLSREAQNKAAEFKLRTERQAGQMLVEVERDVGGRPENNSSLALTSYAKALDELNTTRQTATRWQVEASVPEEDFEEYVARIKANNGEVTSAGLYRIAKDKKRKKERTAMANAAQNIPPSDRWQVYCNDMTTWAAPQQYDFIITDPPYPEEYLPLYETLALRAKDWLQPGGLLVAMCGQSYLDEIMTMMTTYLDYYWTAAYLTPGQPTPLRQRQVNTSWKPLLIFTLKGDTYKGKIFGDVFVSAKPEKDAHDWGQSVSGMSAVIKQICLPGQWILDPFCGAGSTGIAALMHGCLFHGIDIDEDNVNISRSKLGAVKDTRKI